MLAMWREIREGRNMLLLLSLVGVSKTAFSSFLFPRASLSNLLNPLSSETA
jgi:hypothetical protein